MPDPIATIVIPVKPRNKPYIEELGVVTITPAIIDLMMEESELNRCFDALAERVAILERHEMFPAKALQADLEKAPASPAKLILNPSGNLHLSPIDMTRQIGPGIVEARHAAAEPFLGEAHQSELEKAHAPVDTLKAKYIPCTMCGEGVLHRLTDPGGVWLTAQYHDCKNPAPEPVGTPMGTGTWTATTPVDAGGEDAAEMMAGLIRGVHYTVASAEMGKAILAAIRAGKVPGVFCGIDTGKISALRARVAELEHDLATKQDAAFGMDHAMREEISRAENERDRALARVVELDESCRKFHINLFDRTQERDRTIIDLAAERHIREKREVELGQCKSDLAAERDKVKTLLVAGEAQDEQVQAANDEADRLQVAVDGLEQEVEDLKSELSAERERREKAEAKLAQAAAIDSHGNCGLSADGNGCNTMAALRAARAEVAALKARKVSVGRIKCPYEMSETVRQCAYYRGVSDCADAIRAAGVEVSGE